MIFRLVLFCFSELFDIGGSHGHRNSRHVFYNNYQGIILVHDLTNRKSQQNLERWLREIVQYNNRCVKLSHDLTAEASWGLFYGNWQWIKNSYILENQKAVEYGPICYYDCLFLPINGFKSSLMFTEVFHWNIFIFIYSTNGKHKDWDDVIVTSEETHPDVPILVIGTKQDLESQRGSLPGTGKWFDYFKNLEWYISLYPKKFIKYLIFFLKISLCIY